MQLKDKDCKKEENTLRNRKQNTEDNNNKSSIIEDEVKKPFIQDPLYWFSGFPPSSLRNSQTEFKKGTV